MAGAGGHEVERISVKVVPDTGGFAEDLKAFLEREEETAKIDVKLDLDTKEVEAKLKELSKDLTVKIDVELDDAGIREKLDALSRNTSVTVNADLDDKAAEGQLALLTRDRTIHIHANIQQNIFAKLSHEVTSVTNNMVDAGSKITNVFSDIEGGADKASSGFSSIGGAAGKLSAVMQVVGSVIMGVVYAALVNVIVVVGALAGALALALAPAAFIAAGVAFMVLGAEGKRTGEKIKAAFGSVVKTAKSVISDAIKPMTNAINAQIPQINSWIGTLRGPLKSAFSSSSKYVDELTKGLENFSSNTLKGVVEALKNPQLQGTMNGLKQMLADFGTALGSFFSELANNGNDFGKTFQSFGQAMIKIAPALAGLLGAFAQVSPDLINQMATDITRLLNAFSDPGVLKALTWISTFAWSTLFNSISLVVGALSAAGNASTVFQIAAGIALGLVKVAWWALKTAILAAWHAIESAAESIWGAIKKGIIDKVGAAVSSVISAFKSLSGPVSGSWASVGGITSGSLSSILGKVRSFGSSLKSAISDALSSVKNAFRTAWNYISGIVSSISSAIGRVSRSLSGLNSLLSKVNPFSLFSTTEAPSDGGVSTSSTDEPSPFAPMMLAAPMVEPTQTVQPLSITDSIQQINDAGSSLAKSFNDSGLADETSSSGSGVKALAQRVYNFTVNAAPNIPTEETIVKALSYADALYAQ